MAQIELPSLVGLAQSYIVKNYATALIDKSKTAELKAYVGKYLYDTGYSVAGYDTKGLVERLFTEMAEYSILTRHLSNPNLEEININGWDDVAVMNILREEFNLAAADARLHLGKIAFTVPYSSTLIEQYMEGSLYEPMKDKKFMQTIKAIAERVV